jgi:beta-lactamase superfamily II metal-dependent hydrolase
VGKPTSKLARKKPPSKSSVPIRKATTRSASKPGRDAALLRAAQDLLAAQAALAQRRATDLANRPVAPPGSRGDGQLHLAFVKIGQGDCAIMATPRGQILLFDCGSDAKDSESDAAYLLRIKAVLARAKFMAGYDTVDILVLTHPDADHYNQLENILNPTVTIENVYFSSALQNYAQGQTSAFIHGRMSDVNGIKKVVHNHDPANGAPGQVAIGVNGAVPTAVQAAAAPVFVDRLDGAGGIRIVNEPNCKVSILAADVAQQYVLDNSNITNRGSVVTLIETTRDKILICGDATFNTERYLMNTAQARITGVSIAQAGHHGSRLTSSSQAFVDIVNPTRSVISAPKNVPLHHLPSEEVIDRYRTRLNSSNRPLIPSHETFGWRPAGLGSYTNESQFHQEMVYTTGSWDTIEFTLVP